MRARVFFFLGRTRRRNFWFFLLVPIMFPWGSQRAARVPKLFPKTFSIAPQFYLIWFAQSSTLMCINWAYLFLFCNQWCKEVLLLGIAQWGGVSGCGELKPRTSQVPDMFLKEFPIAPHFYPICFGNCCPPFTYVGGSMVEIAILQNRAFKFGSLHRFIFFWVMDQSKIWTWEAPHLINRND
jgi:hypothetical protein